MRRLVLVLALLFLPAAAAHGDVSTWRDTLSLAPGETVTIERPVHWHRVMGTIAADGEVILLADGAVIAGPTTNVKVHHLVRCCDAVWTDMEFAVQNSRDETVQVQVDLAFLHDNFGVIADDAEPGAWWQTLAIVLLLVAIPAWRAREPPVTSEHDWLRTSRILHAAAWGAGALLALVGMLRFGTGPMVGTIGATAWTPMDLGGFFNAHSFVMLALMATWGTAYAFWSGARRRTGRRLARSGYMFAAGPLIIAGLFILEFGGDWIPIVLGVVPAAAILADTLLRQPPEPRPSAAAA